MLETHKSKKSSNYRSLKKINRFISVINKKEGASCITTHLHSILTHLHVFFNSYCKDFPNVAQKREKRASQLYDLWATLS